MGKAASEKGDVFLERGGIGCGRQPAIAIPLASFDKGWLERRCLARMDTSDGWLDVARGCERQHLQWFAAHRLDDQTHFRTMDRARGRNGTDGRWASRWRAYDRSYASTI